MSSNSFNTVLVIAISVILSTGIVMYVPQVQDAIRDPQVETGLQGEQGIPGPQGLRGPTGYTGDVGSEGPTGSAGPIGLTGEQGDIGPQGLDGSLGIQGETGPIGPAGISEVTQAELDELYIRIDELGNMIAELEAVGVDEEAIWTAIYSNNNTIESLESTMADMDAELDYNLSEIDERINALELYSTLIYDSGWKTVEQGKSLYLCQLDHTHVIVYMIGQFHTGSSWGEVISHYNYGGNQYYRSDSEFIERGATWFITPTKQLWVSRRRDDTSYEKFRVYVFEIYFHPYTGEVVTAQIDVDDDPFIIP